MRQNSSEDATIFKSLIIKYFTTINIGGDISTRRMRLPSRATDIRQWDYRKGKGNHKKQPAKVRSRCTRKG